MQLPTSSQALLLAATLFAGSAFAADCFLGSEGVAPFTSTDGLAIADDITAGTVFTFPLEVKAQQVGSATAGTATLCVVNGFFFDNTHVAASDVDFAIRDIISQCSEDGTSNGGNFKIKGDTGLEIAIDVIPTAFGRCRSN
ncbi:uncharacterized protein LTR77_009045 [Saxophila tyrrhenica]|uniref:Uncharacterized protein n=1 Tax=Saxophila tyrrhenica TaxID=1690608 RepID=A0AAV9P2S8_9PEZI|nr:hypothetical protein LTR77_009045 [Saxophila tyrrhenica]